MFINITRKNIFFQPDPTRVIARFLYNNDDRSKALIQGVLALTEKEQRDTLVQVLRDYSKRHRSISRVFEKSFARISRLLPEIGIDISTLTSTQKGLIGSYFTMEYSIEAAAFFNPSIIEDPDQSALSPGEKRVIISFRATGEGHISSIVFRSGVLDKKNDILIEPQGRMLESPEHIRNHTYHKDSFLQKLEEMQHEGSPVYAALKKSLPDTFTYEELKDYVEKVKSNFHNTADLVLLSEVIWLASSHYEMDFSVDTAISERVIFPIAHAEMKGIEDARFVKFTDDDGDVTYYATYTAYDGISILPKLITTKDFYHFKVMPIHGEIAQNKGMALFPRKIKGKYVMLCRSDGVSNSISFSDNITVWRKSSFLQRPQFPWELVQMGNCGSPIETPEGWLVLTHGVGPVREYSIGVSLLDLDNPEKEIGRLPFPLLSPNDREREGYVPNVVYSCGSIINNDALVIPYAMSDYSSTYATVNLPELLAALKRKRK